MSYFKAQKNWLINDLISTNYNKAEIFRFHCVQLSFNTNIFLLDFITGDMDELSFKERLFFGSIDDVLNCVKNCAITDYKITLLSCRDDNDGEYVTSDIVEVIQAKDSANQIAYIYCCKNKKRYVDTMLGPYETDLSQFKTIYKIN